MKILDEKAGADYDIEFTADSSAEAKELEEAMQRFLEIYSISRVRRGANDTNPLVWLSVSRNTFQENSLTISPGRNSREISEIALKKNVTETPTVYHANQENILIQYGGSRYLIRFKPEKD